MKIISGENKKKEGIHMSAIVGIGVFSLVMLLSVSVYSLLARNKHLCEKFNEFFGLEED